MGNPGFPAGSPSPAPVHNNIPRPVTRQTKFTIPFTIDPKAGDGITIQLFLSQNRGQSWQLHDQRRPADKAFVFNAERDGEYWFSSRTVAGRAPPPRPEQTFTPELRVVVDTTQPEFDFQAATSVTGDVILSWRANDVNLVPESMKVEYQSTDRDNWRPIPIPVRPGSDRSLLAGQMPWSPEIDARTVNLRAEVRDGAGNLALINRRVDLPVIVKTPSPTENIVRREPTPEGTSWPRDNQPKPTIGTTGGLTPGGPTPGGPVVGGQAAIGPVATSPMPDPNYPDPSSFPREVSPVQPPVADRVVVRSNSVTGPTGPTNPMSTTPPTTNPAGAVELPAGERPRMSNSKRFRLEYDLDAVGPSGVAEVELWGTKDAGRTWERWGSDEDRQSPFNVEVQAEGLFGFRVVVVGKNGLTSPTPRAGDAADIWIGVDMTKPIGQLTSATYGQGPNAGKLDIRWDARDERLGNRPISLLFGETPNGPWTTIATGMANTGQYLWTIDPRVPRAIFLRLEVRDEAGNLTVHQLLESISTEGLSPKGRIKSFLPADDREAARSVNRR